MFQFLVAKNLRIKFNSEQSVTERNHCCNFRIEYRSTSFVRRVHVCANTTKLFTSRHYFLSLARSSKTILEDFVPIRSLERFPTLTKYFHNRFVPYQASLLRVVSCFHGSFFSFFFFFLSISVTELATGQHRMRAGGARGRRLLSINAFHLE